MVRTAHAQRSVAGLLATAQIHQDVSHGGQVGCRRRHQDDRQVHQRGHHRQIAERLVRQVLVQRRVQRQGAHACRHQRIAVRRGAGRFLRGDDSGGAGAIFHHHRLAQRVAHVLGDDAGRQVAAAAGAEWHQPADRMVRIFRGGRTGGKCGGGRQRRPQQGAADGACTHDVVS
ncbi:hypothetical protein G6F65_017042 [Rhizopus arrhizus]|nr:hypothetical protein G6F65_017042 [Rhizopus arrhizus]